MFVARKSAPRQASQPPSQCSRRIGRIKHTLALTRLVPLDRASSVGDGWRVKDSRLPVLCSRLPAVVLPYTPRSWRICNDRPCFPSHCRCLTRPAVGSCGCQWSSSAYYSFLRRPGRVPLSRGPSVNSHLRPGQNTCFRPETKRLSAEGAVSACCCTEYAARCVAKSRYQGLRDSA